MLEGGTHICRKWLVRNGRLILLPIEGEKHRREDPGVDKVVVARDNGCKQHAERLTAGIARFHECLERDLCAGYVNTDDCWLT